MRTLGAAFVSSFLISFLMACGSASKDNQLAADAKAVADEMCACKDDACADKVKEKRKALRDKARGMYAKKEDVATDLLEKMKVQDKRFGECNMKLRMMGKPDIVAPAPAPASPAPATPPTGSSTN